MLIVLGGLVLLGTALAMLVTTEWGLRWGFARLDDALPAHLTAERIRGRWLGPIRIEGLRYRDAATEVHVRRLHLDWAPAALLRARVRVIDLQAEDVAVERTVPPPERPPKPVALPDVRLPVAVAVERAVVEGLEWRTPDGARRIDRIRLEARTRAFTVAIETFAVSAPRFELDLTGTVRPRGDYRLRLDTDWAVRPPQGPPVRGRGRLSGSLSELRLEQRVQAPAAARVEATLHEPLRELRWEGRVTVAPVALDRLEMGLPEATVGGTLSGRGSLERFKLETRLDGHLPALGELRAEAAVDRTPGGWAISRARLARPASETSIELHGRIEDTLRAALSGSWSGLAWPLDGRPRVRSPSGTFEVAGTVEDYDLEIRARLEAPEWPAATVHATGRGDRRSIDLARLEVETLGGHIRGSGTLAWAPVPRWALNLTGERIDPGVHWPDWPGTLAFAAETSGQLDGALHARVDVERLDGRLRGEPVRLDGRFQADGPAYATRDVHLEVAGATLTADARVDEQWKARWDLRVPDLEAVLPRAGGRLQASGRIAGPRARPRLSAALEGEGLHYAAHGVGAVDAELTLDLDASRSSRLRVSAGDLVLAGRAFPRLTLEGQGRLARHRMTLELTAPGPTELALTVAAELTGRHWQGRITEGRLLPPTGETWAVTGRADIAAAPLSVSVRDLCLTRQARRLCGRYEGTAERWQAELQAEDLPLTLARPWLPSGLGLTGTVAGTGELRGGADRPPGGELRLTGRNATVTLRPPGNREVSVGVAEHRLTLSLDPERAAVEASVRLAEGGRLELRTVLAEPFGRRGLADKAVSGTLSGRLETLTLLDAALPNLAMAAGRAEAELRLDGTLAAPRVRGSAGIRQATVEVPATGIVLRDVSLTARALEGTHLALSGHARSGPGRVTLEGRLTLDAARGWPAELRLTGQRFQVADIPEARVLVSPELSIDIRPPDITLRGRLEVPEARLAPRADEGALRPADDVVVVRGGEPPPESGWRLKAHLVLALGEQVRVQGYGFSGRVTGRLQLDDPGTGVTTARGELSILDGKYKAYGASLDIETGRLVYAGGPADNPGLDLRAVRRTGEVLAGVRVRGTLREPALTLFSEPPMEQADALSYLLLGHPLRQASAAEGQMMFQATQALGLAGGDLLAKRIGELFGIEEVRVEPGARAEAGTETTALVLGKHLSPRLYVNYSVGLFEPTNVFRIRYELGRRWTLQTESGATSGADLIFTIEH